MSAIETLEAAYAAERQRLIDLDAEAGDNSQLRAIARAQLRTLTESHERFRRALPAIEDEAVEAASRVTAWLDVGAGIRDAETLLVLETRHGDVEVPMG